ncbi:shikimate 5-dehydrogenase [Marivirga tractuosa]|uniref:Shikimate dehydrogenase substrate binding domain protein n=1 Tax=Marivirga tractuosa (strain ATCC 23168 / DSM 4126 / NBRC 15989 / NCIMB 1408 / VKM B-1430 / H-43) TaxID=643867 RepID=E4TVK0_MARTH|nr:shikimate 5-dehydrogenase [Marivirga tractuosa]ADR21113.1 Shikimate dehydrogenase substrate binding domain protein [Marivirga tractuosa DSM 4126]BDD14432.1 shikimate 5-dehydrogenase [Marivirga tractuosa]
MSEQGFKVSLKPESKFIFSTSGSASSIEKHNTALQKLGLNLVYFTFPHDIAAKDYADLLRSRISRGGAVTGKDGLKSKIIPFLDEVEEIAKKTLAVNTVVNENGKLYGYNTDAIGLKTALENALKSTTHSIKTAAIYGNGGVSGVAYHILKELGLKVKLTGRNPEKVKAKKEDLGIEDDEISAPYDLIVDATPISSQPNFLEAKGFSELLNNCKMLFCHNMPEKDNKPNYLKSYCEENNIEFIPGSAMYKAQLIRQYQLFIGDISAEAIIEKWHLKD